MVSFRKRGDLHGQSKENPRRSACGGNRRKRNYSGIDAAEEKQLRRKLVEKALKALETEVEDQTVFED